MRKLDNINFISIPLEDNFPLPIYLFALSQILSDKYIFNIMFIFLCLKSCADVKVTNKTLFPTFSRTSLGPPEKISKSVIALLKAYQWTKFVIVADTRQWTKEITLAIKVRTLLN